MPPAFAAPPRGPTPARGAADPGRRVVAAPDRPGAVAVGDVFRLRSAGASFTASSRDRGHVPGGPGDRPFVARSATRPWPARRRGPIRPSVLFVRGDATLRAGVAMRRPRRTRGADFAPRPLAARDAPFVAGVAGGFGLALAVALVYATLAVVAVSCSTPSGGRASSLPADARPDRPQAAGLTAVEHGLPILVAVVVGVALGLGVAAARTGSRSRGVHRVPDATVRLESTGRRSAVVAAVVWSSWSPVARSSWLAGRLELGPALRIGDE